MTPTTHTLSVTPALSARRVFGLGTLGLLLAMLFWLVAPPAGAQVGSCAPGEFESQFFNNTSLSGSPVLTRCDASIDFNWGGGSPAPQVNGDNFSARFTAQKDFAAGWYSFDVLVDDGFRLNVDGVEVMQSWRQQPPTGYSSLKKMTAGSHQVVIEYVEVGGGAVIRYSASPTTYYFSATTVTVAEGDLGSLLVQRGGTATPDASSIQKVMHQGTASANGDYGDESPSTPDASYVHFPAGETSAPFSFSTLEDDIYEGNETFTIALGETSAGQVVAPSQAVVTIVDDDPVPMLLLGDVTQVEGDVGSSSLTFTLALSNPSSFGITGNYVLADGSAQAPGDLNGTGGSFTIPAGATSTTVSVPIQGEYVFEADETFSIELLNVTNVDAGSSDFSATGTITNDDAAPPTVSVTAPEGNAGATPSAGPGVPCKLTLTSNYMFLGLVTFVGVRVTRDDAPVADIRVFSKHSWSPKITSTRTNAFGYVEYHFRTVTPGASVEFIADCDGNGLTRRSASLAQELAARVTNPSLLSTRNLTQVGAFIGQGRRAPASHANCSTVSVTSSNLKANRRGNVTVKVRFAGLPVNAAAVTLSGVGVSRVKATTPTGNVSFTVTPTRSGNLDVRVPNFASCANVESLAVAAP